jgi:hypothetical protein
MSTFRFRLRTSCGDVDVAVEVIVVVVAVTDDFGAVAVVTWGETVGEDGIKGTATVPDTVVEHVSFLSAARVAGPTAPVSERPSDF